MVVFDGAGSVGDDYDFSDNVATLHTTSGLADILGTTSGQVALYVAGGVAQLYLPAILNTYNSFNPPVPSPPTAFPEPAIVSFVAWGAAPGNLAATATKAGLWSPRWFKSLARGLGAGFPSTTPNETIGLLPGSLTGYPDDWAFYLAGEVTKGGENPVPGISFSASNRGDDRWRTFTISWAPVQKATGYQFRWLVTATSAPTLFVVAPRLFICPHRRCLRSLFSPSAEPSSAEALRPDSWNAVLIKVQPQLEDRLEVGARWGT